MKTISLEKGQSEQCPLPWHLLIHILIQLRTLIHVKLEHFPSLSGLSRRCLAVRSASPSLPPPPWWTTPPPRWWTTPPPPWWTTPPPRWWTTRCSPPVKPCAPPQSLTSLTQRTHLLLTGGNIASGIY